MLTVIMTDEEGRQIIMPATSAQYFPDGYRGPVDALDANEFSDGEPTFGFTTESNPFPVLAQNVDVRVLNGGAQVAEYSV